MKNNVLRPALRKSYPTPATIIKTSLAHQLLVEISFIPCIYIHTTTVSYPCVISSPPFRMESPRRIGGNITLLQQMLLLLFCTFFFLCCSSSAQNPLPLISLLSLKASLVDPVGSLQEWQPPPPPPPNNQPPVAAAVWCSWQGVKCDPETDQIVSLDLSSRNLSGAIPPEIRFVSSSLMHLNLSSNAFDGAFPRTLFTLSQLRTLDISHNNFNSSFPPAVGISNLQFLRLFSAYSNSFSGPLPDDFVRLRFLTHLNLGGSYFQGSIPVSYSRFARLKFLDLAGNSLDGPLPPELGGLTQLERLEIGYNKFHGRIPVEFAILSNLNYLDMSQNNLSGPLPPELGNLTMLDTLLLFKNHFSGEIPATYGNIRGLRVLDLSDNSLSGSIPPQLSQLKQLVQLSLMTNQLTGKIPQDLADLTHLDTLLLWNNSFTGILPQRLGCNGKLIKLDVSSNHLTGPIPLNLCLRNTLVKLILFSNNFTSSLPQSVTNCSSLARVRIQNNRLNGSIPYGFGLLPNLTYMDLSGNAFSGSIPKDLGNAKGLEYLNMSYNSFESELPDNIWSAPNLQILSAISSKIVGRIPDFVGCTSLYKIELEGNYLSGNIPWDIDHCVKLISLNFRRNSLSGIIPWEISTLPSITDVDLSHNLLTGTIPSDFDNCSTLENFNVSFNRLTGPIPSSGPIFPNLHPSSFTGNEGLCGGVLLQINPCNKSTTTTSSSVNNNDAKKTAGAIVWIIAAAFGVGLLVLIAGTRCFHANYSRGERKDEDRQIAGGGGPWKLTAFQRLNFSADDVLECLSTSDKIIGMGSTGTVYRAEMPGGEVIAVKKLWAMKHLKETVRRRNSSGVLAEVEVLGNVRHRNIVRLLGCCSNNRGTTMLLYEYMPNGSLHDLLHGKKNSFAAGCWMTRYKIALGVAQGICYLHHDCHPLIVHRDLKPSNILLDAEMEARVADFGVAKLIQSDESMSVIAGSYGYIAPEYAYTLQVDEKSDIYSYGVVLMEILSGKKSVEAEFGEGNSIVDWVRSKMKSKDGIKDVLDNNAGASCKLVREEMLLLLRVALLCTSRNPAERPSMRDVVSMLQEAQPTRKSPQTLTADPIKSVVY